MEGLENSFDDDNESFWCDSFRGNNCERLGN